MKLEEAKELLKKEMQQTLYVIEKCSLESQSGKEQWRKEAEAIRTVLQEIDHLQKKYDTDTHILQGQLDLANAEKIELQKENEELRIARDNYKGCFIVTKENSISKDNIREKIEKLKPQLEETDKRTEKAKVQEERIVLKCIGIRLDERIKTLQDLLKEE